ncbi:MAG: lipid-A-disaccharide synthase [Paludibacteraceae bacterium]|nr:lipid-A-disaccharide synthase [Paludibacteraceae bacterium]
MKYYLIAGEASGDLHGSNLIKSIIKRDPNAQFRYYGGDKMLAEGGELVKHYKDTAIMGFVRVAMNARKILGNIADCKDDIAQFAPDILILIDYPGFNLEIAKYAKIVLNLTVVYYIPPKIWAWKEGRVEQIKKYIDKVYCIFPFEVEFYRSHGYENVEYIGNPCVQSVAEANIVKKEDFFLLNGLDADKKIVALLPGSRKQEVEHTIKVLNKLDKSKYNDCQFVMACTGAVDRKLYDNVDSNIVKVYDLTYPLLSFADAAIVNSGTATLETALFNVPEVVVYPIVIPKLLYKFGRKYMLKVSYISLVNIILERELVKELVAFNYTKENVQQCLDDILYNDECRKNIKDGYKEIASALGDAIASDVAAESIRTLLRMK